MDRTTNVPEDTRITIGVALALWGATIAGAGASGLFEKLELVETTGFAAFAMLFAVTTYFIDREVRAFVDAARRVWAWAAVLDVAVALAFPHAASMLFLLPLAGVATIAALNAALRDAPVRPARAKSPGASPFAT
jgi:hypothetical protein